MTHGTTAAIEVESLQCGYGDNIVLEDVSFSVFEGEVVFLVGGNGSGKSTLLRHLVGLMDPIAGRISYFGQSFTDSSQETRRALLRSIGILYQHDALWSSMTLMENISLPLEEHTNLSRREREQVARFKLAQVGLSGQEHRFPVELSGGMRKRAALARAIALDPAIVFFDEPSAGLDPVNAQGLENLILETREIMGTTIVVVSHKLADIYNMADRAILLDSGKRGIAAEGDPRELAEHHEDEEIREFLTVRLVDNAPPRVNRDTEAKESRT